MAITIRARKHIATIVCEIVSVHIIHQTCMQTGMTERLQLSAHCG